MAVIDTKRQCIVRVFNTSVLPKMVATSHDGKTIAVTHWGDNTVCTIDCHDANPARWRYTNEYVVDYRFVVHAPKDSVINRDMGSGNALRGTLFTPDDRYLLVGCMGGSGGIAVIDLQQHKYLGRLTGMMQNLRHLIISGDYIYLSINSKGYVQRLPLTNLYAAIDNFANGKKVVPVNGWQSAKVGAGARTICASPDGRFIFAACNFSNCVSVVDARTMKEVIRIAADSYPVGMDITSDGKTLIVTSQGRRDKGGNSVDIFSIK
jgi:DNA-binding beta-propeller fold protein YncE